MSRKASDEERYPDSGARSDSAEGIDVVEVQLQLLDPGLPVPSYARPGDAGADLHLVSDTILQPGERELVGTGVAIALPEGYVGLVHPRSGMAASHGLSIVNAPGTVDAGYRGEIKVCLINTDPTTPIKLSRGDRIAQLVIQRVSRADFVTVSQLPGSIRGSGGHGSTGGMPAEPTDEPVATLATDVRPDQPDSNKQEKKSMIFRSRRRRNASTDGAEAPSEALDESSVSPDDSAADSSSPDSSTSSGSSSSPESSASAGAQADESDAVAPTLAELDAQDWRDLGPYDLSEVDSDALEDELEEQARIDLGSIVLGAVENTELRLQVDENSQQVVSAMMIRGDSALEVGAFAAPRSGGLWSEIRDELVQAAHQAGGSADLVPGPFGVELRRLLPVQTPDGQEGYQPSRMWVAEGPRWMLRGIVYGQAALQDGVDGPIAEFLEAFRTIVVRRGDEAMAPGDLLPLSLPENATPVAPATAEPGDA